MCFFFFSPTGGTANSTSSAGVATFTHSAAWERKNTLTQSQMIFVRCNKKKNTHIQNVALAYDFPVIPDRPPEVGPVTAEIPRCSFFPQHVDSAAVSQHAVGDGPIAAKKKEKKKKRPAAQTSLLHTLTHSHLHRAMASHFAREQWTHR